MRIAVDLDGVLYHWEKTARYMLRTQKGHDLKESEHWYSIRDAIPDEDWAWLWSEAPELGLFRQGHVMKGGIDGIRALKRRRHELVVCTHRPVNAVRDTISWLDHHFGSEKPYPWDGMHILSNGEPKSGITADILIDDKPENLIDWVESDPSRIAIQFMQPWNEDTPRHDRIFRAYGWEHLIEVIDDIEWGLYAVA